MVIPSEFRIWQHRDDAHREDAPHFTITRRFYDRGISCHDLNEACFSIDHTVFFANRFDIFDARIRLTDPLFLIGIKY